MGNHGVAGVSQNAGALVVLVGSDDKNIPPLVQWLGTGQATSHYLNQ